MASPVVLPNQTRKEPAIIRAGDTVVWQRTFNDYGPPDFTLSYVLVSTAAQYGFTAGLSTDGSGAFLIQIPSATTATWAAGLYRWEAYVKDSTGDRITIDEGELRILANLETATGGIDDREDDEKILDAIKTLLAGKVLAGDAQMYEIHQRKLTRYTFAELEKLRGQYALRVRNIRIRRGERVSSRSVRTAFRG